ncbi:MAG TPA: hypothetical protein PLQ57_07365 [Saprospiraceae bacterium]|nr:hypothetical protein [Saprospiraceae bacterium]
MDYIDLDSIGFALYNTRRNSLIDGVIIEKIEPKSGKLFWQKIDNSFTGNFHFQRYWDLHYKEGELSLFGMRAKDNSKSFSPNMCVKKYNAITGEIRSYSTDTTEYSFSPISGIPVYPIYNNSHYIACGSWVENVNLKPRQGIEIFSFNENLKRDTFSKLILNETLEGDSFTLAHIPVRPLYTVIDDHLIACVFFYLAENETGIKKRAELVIVDFSNFPELKLVSRNQFGHEIFDYPDEQFYCYLSSNYEKEIQLTWRYPKVDINSNKILRACSYISFDTLGNILLNVADVAQENHWIYHLRYAGKLNNKDYLIGKRSDDRASFDVIEVGSESKSRILVSVVTADRPSNDGFSGSNTIQHIRQDSTLIFSGALFTKGGDVVPSTTSTLYTMAFDLRQWMRPTASEEVVKDLTIKLYPNPSHEYLNIEVPDVKGKLHFYASNGALLKTISINGSQSLLVDTSLFPVGVNVITIEPAEKTGVVRSVTFAKM